MASSPPSFDHLPSTSAAERESHAVYPTQAQVCRDGRMKYQRMRAPTSDNEVVMPDGEIVCDANYVGGTRYSGGCPGLSRAGAIGRPLPQGRPTGGPTDVFSLGLAATANAATHVRRRDAPQRAAPPSAGRATPPP